MKKDFEEKNVVPLSETETPEKKLSTELSEAIKTAKAKAETDRKQIQTLKDEGLITERVYNQTIKKIDNAMKSKIGEVVKAMQF